jgi:hypothetical protein
MARRLLVLVEGLLAGHAGVHAGDLRLCGRHGLPEDLQGLPVSARARSFRLRRDEDEEEALSLGPEVSFLVLVNRSPAKKERQGDTKAGEPSIVPFIWRKAEIRKPRSMGFFFPGPPSSSRKPVNNSPTIWEAISSLTSSKTAARLGDRANRPMNEACSFRASRSESRSFSGR